MITSYFEIFNNSFGLFQFYFRKLMLVVPIFVIIAGLIYLFYIIVKK